MKRWVKATLCSSLALGLLALVVGCQTAQSSGKTSRDAADGNGGDPVTIEYWHVNSKDWGGDGVKEIVKKFNETHENIRVEEKYQPGNYPGLLQKAQAAISGGNPPDVAQIGYNFITYVDENVPYTPIEELATKDAEEPNFVEDNFLPNILDLGRTGSEKLAGLPYAVSNPVLYYNADLLKEAGADLDKPPHTWEDVQKLSERVRDKTGKYGLYIQEPPDNWAQYGLAKSNGGDWLREEGGKLKAAFDSPEVTEVYDMMGEMVKDKRALHANWEEGIQAFSNGKVAMMLTTIGKREHIESQSKFDVRTTLFPTFGDKPRAIPAGGNALFVLATDAQKQAAAWEFIKYLQSPEALTIWVQETGYLPPRKGVDEDPKALKPFLDSNPLMKPALEQMDVVVPWVNFPGANGLQAEQALIDARDDVLTGKSTAKDALKRAAEKVNELLN
ncbi:ABC transporter substrate-binding protein [Numidum massiliense]|uniref:ABC transporter substrate-binding protein n=1 Tax=Numidum massiliense TaxID=1522315 RepID=UPI0006D594D1|nr:ABC transporter substrate-binding protein [Numidum massiliense]